MRDKPVTTVVEPQSPRSSSPAWNLQELLTNLEDDRAFLGELLEVYLRDSQTSLQEAKDAIVRKDLTVVERRAHTLKGMMRNLMMNAVAQLASDLETAAREGNADDSSRLLPQLERAMSELLPEVDAQIAEART